MKHEDLMIKLYALGFLTQKCVTENRSLWGSMKGQSIYRGTSESRGTILIPPSREPAIEKVAKYGMKKLSVRFVV
jgi:hypothetical protein